MDTLILILYAWHIEGKKEHTAWVEMCSISNKNRNDLNTTSAVILVFFYV